MLETKELLRASATDIDAVLQYISSLDKHAVNELLSELLYNGKKEKIKFGNQQLSTLIHLLMQSNASRLQTSKRLINILKDGQLTELEASQWLSELQMGYAAASYTELGDSSQCTQKYTAVITNELYELLGIVLEYVSKEVTVEKKQNVQNLKVVSHLLSILPPYLGFIIESEQSSERNGTIMQDLQKKSRFNSLSEILYELICIPWDLKSVPLLLGIMKDCIVFASEKHWEDLENLISTLLNNIEDTNLASEAYNALFRELLAVAIATSQYTWITLSRVVFRALPACTRQEAEFNLQMAFSQSLTLVELVCTSMRKIDKSYTATENIANNELPLDYKDIIILFHALQASKPLLHHRKSSSRVAFDAHAFDDIQTIALAIFRKELANHNIVLFELDTRVMNTVVQWVKKLLHFGGRAAHTSEWKSLLMLDFCIHWNKKFNSKRGGDSTIQYLSQIIILAVFDITPEVQREILNHIFESCRSTDSKEAQNCLEILSYLIKFYGGHLQRHIKSIQDFLQLLIQNQSGLARNVLVVCSPLVIQSSDFYHFLMVFLRKLLSAPNIMHQKMAVEIWCYWLDLKIPSHQLDHHQYEEIIAAIMNAMNASYKIRIWTLVKLQQLFAKLQNSPKSQINKFSIPMSSVATVHRVLNRDLNRFFITNDRSNDVDCEDEDEYIFNLELSDSANQSLLLHMPTMEGLSILNSRDAAQLFHKILMVQVELEVTAAVSFTDFAAKLGTPGRDLLRWAKFLAADTDALFHWICGAKYSAHSSNDRKSYLLRRLAIAISICSIIINTMLCDGISIIEHSSSATPGKSARGLRTNILSPSVGLLLETFLYLSEVWGNLGALQAQQLEDSNGNKFQIEQLELSAPLETIHQGLGFRMNNILEFVNQQLKGQSSGRKEGGIFTYFSYKAILFILKVCEDHYTPKLSEVSLLCESGHLVEVAILLQVLKNLVSRCECQPHEDLDLDDSGNFSLDEQIDRPILFASYSDGFARKLPKFIRASVQEAANKETFESIPNLTKFTQNIAILNQKVADEILSCICLAINGIVSRYTEKYDIVRGNAMLQQISLCGDSSENCFYTLSYTILSHAQNTLASYRLPRFLAAATGLSDRLIAFAVSYSIEVGKNLTTKLDQLANCAYEVMCQNIISHAPTLKNLLALTFCAHRLRGHETTVSIELETERLNAVIEACMLAPTECKNSESDSEVEKTKTSYLRQKKLHRRRRLRCPQDDKVDFTHSVPEAQLPHLTSSSCRSTSIAIALTRFQRALLTVVNWNGYCDEGSSNSPLINTIPYRFKSVIDISHLLKHMMLCQDGSWVTGRTLMKLIVILGLVLRIAQLLASLKTNNQAVARLISSSENLDSLTFTSCIELAHQARIWISLLKEATSDATIRSKLSSLALKIDVFLLNTPSLARQFVRKKTDENNSDEKLKEQLQEFLKCIHTQFQHYSLHISGNNHQSSTKVSSKSRPPHNNHRLYGVVPIVSKKRKRLRSRNAYIDSCLQDESGNDAFVDLEDFIEY